MPFAKIISTGSDVPDRIVTNSELEDRLGEPVADWLVANVGIRERRVMAPGQTTLKGIGPIRPIGPMRLLTTNQGGAFENCCEAQGRGRK